jgi:glycosyltransferase involved in cell wall biosynthesis
MACYNADRFIGQALDSVSAQTYRDYEVIVVDDGSTDDSELVIERHVTERMTILKQDNSGAAKARNRALSHADADFAIFLDADDLIAPTHLETMVRRLDGQHGCVALSQWDRFITDPAEARFPDRTTERDMAGPDWLELDWRLARPMTQSGMILLPRKLLEQNGGWDERLTLIDDFEFFARMLSRCSGVRFAAGARLYYRSAVPGSLSAQKSRSAVESALLSLDLGTQHLLASKDTPESRRACANLLKAFDYEFFPHHGDLRALACSRAAELGGADIDPAGPPGFHKLRQWIGWKGARLVQRGVSRARRWMPKPTVLARATNPLHRRNMPQ